MKKRGTKKRKEEGKRNFANKLLQMSKECEDEDSFVDVERCENSSEHAETCRPTADSDSAMHMMQDHALKMEENLESDAEYDELCAAVQRANSVSNDSHEDADTDEEELQDVELEQQEINHNMHSDLVTPELSAEEEQVPNPPKVSQKSHKKIILVPKDDRHRKSSRKLDYQNAEQDVPPNKAVKRKLLPKSNPNPKRPKHIINKKKQLQERNIRQDGTWVQCMRSGCSKWRYLREVSDPSLIPDYWVCEKNTDLDHDSCKKSEEDYHSLEFVLTKYTEGSIVWAKMQGYPWWPALVEEDPDTGTYLEQEDPQCYPTHYHVVFLDKNVSRTWLKSSLIRKYSPMDDIQMQAKGRNFKKQIGQAMDRANHALTMSVQERIKTYGFSHTFRGKIVDDYEQSSEDEPVDSVPSNDAPEEDSDAEFDLDLLRGLNVEDILEQAEALLSEAGETMQSLQGSAENQELPKKKREKKSKKGVSQGNVMENKDKEAKRQRKHKRSSEGEKEKNTYHKKKKRHHKPHRSEKSSEETTERDPVSAIAVEDCSDPTSEAEKDGLKNSTNAVIDDGVTKTVKKHSKKQSPPNEDLMSNLQDAQNTKETKEGTAVLRPKEKKHRKPRVKNLDDESKPKTKKPRAKKTSSAEDSSTTADEMAAQRKPTDDTVPGTPHKSDHPLVIKKHRKKQHLVGDNLQGTSQNLEHLSEPKHNKRSKKSKTADDTLGGMSKNLDYPSEPKSSKKNKDDDATPKKKPIFKPPSKSKQDSLETEVQKTSFNTPLAEKMDASWDESTRVTNKTTDKISDDAITAQEKENVHNEKKISKKSSVPKQKKLKKPDASAEERDTFQTNASKKKGKAKFSVRKTSSLFSLQPEETTTVKRDEIDVVQKLMDDPSGKTDPRLKFGSTESSKRAISKKFSIEPQTSSLRNVPTPPLQSTSPQRSDKNVSNAAILTSSPKNIASVDTEPEVPCKKPLKQKAAKKRFTVKRQQSPKLQRSNRSTVDMEIKEAMTLPQPKKMMSGHEEKRKQQKSHADDSDTFFSVDESPLHDATAMETRRRGDRVDNGDDSDDFSMDDLQDWAQDVSGNPVPTDSNPLDKLAGGSNSDSQPFETVEE